MLTRSDLLGPVAAPFTPGLVIVDWHGENQCGAMTQLLALPKLAPLPIEVSEILAGGEVRERQIIDATYASEIAMQIGLTPIVHSNFDATAETIGTEGDRIVSEGLAEIIRRLKRRPAFMVVAGAGVAVEVARVLGFSSEVPFGEIRPGVPVLRLNPKGQFPGLPFVLMRETNADISSIAGIVQELRER